MRPFDAESKVAFLGMHVTAPVPSMATKTPDANAPPEIEALDGAPHGEGSVGAARRCARGHRSASARRCTQLAAAGRIDPAYASPPTHQGWRRNPGPHERHRAGPGLPDVRRPHDATALPSKKDEILLAGKAWIIAAAGGLGSGSSFWSSPSWSSLKEASAHEEAEAAAGVRHHPRPRRRQLRRRRSSLKIKDAIAKIDNGNYGSGIATIESLGAEAQGEDVHHALFKAYSQTSRPKEAMREVALHHEGQSEHRPSSRTRTTRSARRSETPRSRGQGRARTRPPWTSVVASR